MSDAVPTRPYTEYRDTPLWHALELAITELQATHEISVATAPDYVIGYLCRELVARRVVGADALRDTP